MSLPFSSRVLMRTAAMAMAALPEAVIWDNQLVLR
jgi:hypothetical protein